MNKKAEMGVGTLIIFIAMLLVAAVAAGVLIQTAGTLQEQSLATGDQATSQISTHAETIEVSAIDGRNGNLTDFQQIVKLSPGSDPIKLNQVIFSFNTKDNTGTLKYKGTNGVCDLDNVNGYNTWNEQVISNSDIGPNSQNFTLNEDLDDDGADDYVFVDSTGDGSDDSITFELSTDGLINASLGDDIDAADGNVSISSVAVTNGTKTWAYVSVVGLTTGGILNASVVTTVTPYELGEGYFTATYEQQGTNWVDGNLQRGDIIRICYEAPRDVTEDEEIRLNLIPKIGTSTLTQFVTPDVISTERVYLYP